MAIKYTKSLNDHLTLQIIILFERIFANKMLREAILEYGTVGAFHCKDIYDLKDTCKPEDVHTFECQVDTTESSISFVGDRFPNLRKLKLNNSVIPNMRDIGCRFTNLRFLSLARCGITSLNGISTISQVLEELYLAFNKIDDCSELVGMDSLTVIDLEENNISDLSNIEFLSTCSNLQSLTLSGNPCVDDPETYRTKVRDLLPKLRYLDEKRLQPKEERPNPRRARIRNEITYRKMKPKEPEPEKIQSIEPEEEKSLIKESAKDQKQTNQSNEVQQKVESKESEVDKAQTKAKSKSKSDQSEKSQQKTNEKEQSKDSEPAKAQSKSKGKSQSNPQKADEKTQSKQPEKVMQKISEKSQSKELETEKIQSKTKSKSQSNQTDKNQSKHPEKSHQKSKEKSQSKESDIELNKSQTKTKEKEKSQSAILSKAEENQTKDSQSTKSSKKVQIHEPPNPPSKSPSFPISEPPNSPPQSSRTKEPQYENDDEVIITEMLDDLIEDRPPTARGNYESKFFKDSFELQQRNKTPVILKAKPHVITPKIPRNKRPRAISSIKKGD